MSLAYRHVSVPVAGVFLVGLSALPANGQESAEALEQPATEPSSDTAGGIKIAEGAVFRPRLELQTGYQSNVFYEAGDLNGSALMRLGLGGTLASEAVRGEAAAAESEGSGRRFTFKADANLAWNQYLTGESAITEHNDLGIGLLVDARLNPDGVVAFQARDGFSRVVAPPPSETGEGLDRDKNELLLGLIFRPGGGAIQGYTNYTFTVDMFERSELDFGNRMSHLVAAGARWQWLPRTQFSGEASVGFVSPGAEGLKTNGTPIRAWVGASTLITPTFGAILRAGFGNALYDGTGSNPTYIAVAEARLAVGPSLRLAAGYGHEFQDSMIGDFYTDHSLSVRGLAQLGRTQARARAELRLRDYSGIPREATLGASSVDFCSSSDTCGMDSDRSDLVARFDASVDHRFSRWLAGGVSYSLFSDTTDFVTRSGPGMEDEAKFLWQELVVKASATY